MQGLFASVLSFDELRPIGLLRMLDNTLLPIYDRADLAPPALRRPVNPAVTMLAEMAMQDDLEPWPSHKRVLRKRRTAPANFEEDYDSEDAAADARVTALPPHKTNKPHTCTLCKVPMKGHKCEARKAVVAKAPVDHIAQVAFVPPPPPEPLVLPPPA